MSGPCTCGSVPVRSTWNVPSLTVTETSIRTRLSSEIVIVHEFDGVKRSLRRLQKRSARHHFRLVEQDTNAFGDGGETIRGRQIAQSPLSHRPRRELCIEIADDVSRKSAVQRQQLHKGVVANTLVEQF